MEIINSVPGLGHIFELGDLDSATALLHFVANEPNERHADLRHKIVSEIFDTSVAASSILALLRCGGNGDVMEPKND